MRCARRGTVDWWVFDLRRQCGARAKHEGEGGTCSDISRFRLKLSSLARSRFNFFTVAMSAFFSPNCTKTISTPHVRPIHGEGERASAAALRLTAHGPQPPSDIQLVLELVSEFVLERWLR